jgi:cytidine deaminase
MSDADRSPALTPAQERALAAGAVAARKAAHAPYSDYRVGAALLAADGAVDVGCNVENASYGLTICAERNAVFAAVAAGRRRFRAVAVATVDGGSPCGACRQVLREFAPPPADAEFLVLLVDARGRVRARTTLAALLPASFGPERLGKPRRPRRARR